MSGPDGGLWDRVTSDRWFKMNVAAGGLDWQRVEDVTRSGRPDTEGTYAGRTFFLELKQCKRPVRSSTALKPEFRSGQIPWMRRRQRAGGSVGVLLLVQKNHREPYGRDGLYLLRDVDRMKDLADGGLCEDLLIGGDAFWRSDVMCARSIVGAMTCLEI